MKKSKALYNDKQQALLSWERVKAFTMPTAGPLPWQTADASIMRESKAIYHDKQ